MKKFALVLVLLMIVSMLAGCGSVAKQIVDMVEENAAVDVRPGGETQTLPATESAEATEVATEASDENAVSMGRIAGGVYTNQYAGYACELSSDWVFYSAEELQSLPQDVADMIGDSDLLDDEAVLSQFTDMMAESAENLATINVLYQKLSLQERLAYAVMDEKTVLETMLEEKDTMIQAFANAGIAVDEIKIVTVNFLGEERLALHNVASIDGIPYYTLQIFDFDLGAYGVTLTFASFVEDNTAALAELFYAVS